MLRQLILFNYVNNINGIRQLLYFNKEERNALFTTMSQGFKDKLNNNWTVLTSIIEIAVLYGVLYIFGLPSELNKMPKSISFILTILIILTTISIVVFVFNNFLNVKIVDMIYRGIAVVFEESAKEEEQDQEEARKLEPIKKEEVFNISNNLYTYEEAPYVCKALNARLANYDEIEQSYEAAQNGVIMDGLKDKWHSSQHKKIHGRNFKQMKNQKMHVVVLV